MIKWPTEKKYRGVIFKKIDKSTHHGTSPEGLACFLMEKEFGSRIGSTGYIVITQDNLVSTESIDEMLDIFKKKSCGAVHGGLSYVKNDLPLTIPVTNSVVLGFDTSHDFSPRYAQFEFMIDEVLKLACWAYAVITATEDDYHTSPYTTVKTDSEDYFSYILRSIEEAGRKLPLPKENEYYSPFSYIEEVIRRIENGYSENEELSEEEKEYYSNIEASRIQGIFKNLMQLMKDQGMNLGGFEGSEGSEGSEDSEDSEDSDKEEPDTKDIVKVAITDLVPDISNSIAQELTVPLGSFENNLATLEQSIFKLKEAVDGQEELINKITNKITNIL